MKKNKTIKQILLIALFLVIMLLIYKILDIYAVFQSEVDGKVQFAKGAWNIDVNGVDITNGMDIKFDINDIEIFQNKNAKPGKIAPGMNGKFNIFINPRDTDVSIKYDISIVEEDCTIKINNIKDENNQQLIKTEPGVYTGIIPLSEIKQGKSKKIEFEIQWINDETKNMEDTQLGKNLTHKFKIPVNIHFEQYTGETITPIVSN